MKTELDNLIRDELARLSTCTITSHLRADGDAYGSLLGLGTALKNAGKTVHFLLQDQPDTRYSFLPNFSEIVNRLPEEPGFIIVVDSGDYERTGSVLQGLEPDLVIDHHATNPHFGRINLVETDTEACALVLENHIPNWGLSIDKPVAECLLTGILADTIGFRTANVKPDCLNAAARLMEAGADLPRIYQKVLLARSYSELLYWGQGLSKLKLENGLVWTSLSLADRAVAQYPTGDDADLVNNLTIIDGMQIAVIFVEQGPEHTKVSWRAREGYDVSLLAAEFGGGGHIAAAGAELQLNLEEAKRAVLARTRQYLDEKRQK